MIKGNIRCSYIPPQIWFLYLSYVFIFKTDALWYLCPLSIVLHCILEINPQFSLFFKQATNDDACMRVSKWLKNGLHTCTENGLAKSTRTLPKSPLKTLIIAMQAPKKDSFFFCRPCNSINTGAWHQPFVVRDVHYVMSAALLFVNYTSHMVNTCIGTIFGCAKKKEQRK